MCTGSAKGVQVKAKPAGCRIEINKIDFKKVDQPPVSLDLFSYQLLSSVMLCEISDFTRKACIKSSI